MALDREAFHARAQGFVEHAEQQEAQAQNQAAWAAKPWYERLTEGTMADAVMDTGRDLATTAISTGTRVVNAYEELHAAQIASRDKYGVYIPTPEVQEASRDLRGAGVDFMLAPVRVVADHATRPIRSYIGSKIEQSAQEGSEFAQDVRGTETFVNYFMTDEDKLRKAREIEANTGISVDAFMDDDVAFKQALRINDYANMKKNLMQGDFSMEAVWQEFPELRDVAKMSPRNAALALHDIESVRQTHGIVETFTHFLAVGNKKLEYDNLQYKIMIGAADDNDRQRAADLAQMMEEDEKKKPSFLDDPLAAIVGGMASSGPEMLESVRVGVRDGLITAEAAAIAMAAAGTAIEPGGGTLLGGAVGAGAGFTAGFARGFATSFSRSVLGSVARRQAMRTAMTRGMQAGMFEGMRRPETGARYAEYGEMKDKDDNPLLTDNDRRFYAALGGAANAGIEMANFGIATKPLVRGVNALGKSGYAETAIKGVVDAAKYDVAKRESISAFAKSQVKDTLKIAATESLEEGAQSLSDDLIHNRIVSASDGRTADKAYSLGDMAANALVSSVEAFPAGLGFGMMSTMGGASIGSVRHARRLSSEKMQEQLAAQRTMTGTVMLDRLQQVASSAKLKQTAPDVQQKIIRTQVHGTGFENAYIDTEMAMKKENGLADLKEVAKTAGIRDEELEKTIQSGGHLFVPAERYAQSAASPQLLESVSFTPETDSIARMKENAKALSDALEGAQKSAIKSRTEIINSIASEYFPKPADHLDAQEKARMDGEREMATAVISQNPDNPAAGWRSLYNEFTATRDEILKPAMEALSRGMKKGVDILPLGEDGRGIRVSNNAPWYQAYYKKNGKAPNKAQLRDLAYLLTVGDASAPEVEGWTPTTREAAEAMDGARGELDELNGYIKTLENIKDRMMKVDSFEVKGSAGLSPEAYSVYRQIVELLENVGVKQKEDKQTKVARMNALLFAHHADIFAKAMRTQNGNENYTAMAYFKKRFDLRYGGKYMRDGFAQSSSARRLKEDMLAWKQKVDDFFAGKLALRNNVMMRSPLVFDLIGADSSLDVAIDSNILQKLVDKHHFTRKDLLQLPKKIADPLFVLRAIDTKTGVEDTQKRIVVVDMEINGATVMIPFVLNTSKGFNKIASAYGRETPSGQPNDAWYIDRLNDKHLLYVHKNRTARWVATRTGAAGSHNAPLTKQSFSKLSIPDETALGKLKKENQGFYQSAWHGSPYDFNGFDLGAIGTGEGAQAHGWGLYFAKAKKTAASYRERLSSKNELEIVYDGKKSEELTGDIKAAIQLLHLQGFRPEDNLGKFIKTRVKDYTEMIRRWENRIREIDNTLSTNAAQAAQAQLYEERKDNVDRVAASKNVVRQLKLIDTKKAVIKGAGSLFHVEIPDNDVLLDEDKSYTKQPLKVREALEKLVRWLTLDQLENWNDVRRLGKSKVIAEIMDALSESNGMNIYGTISDLAEGQKEASVLLNQYGIKGITYGGQEDGRCYVIFDDKAISIIEKFNQMLRQEVKGEISKEDGKRIITLFESADESTFMHEMGHMFLMDLDELAKIDEASAKDLETVNAWAQWHEGAADEYADTDFADEFRDHENAILAAKKAGDTVAEKAAMERWRQERFARGFEMYLAEGKAPSAAMRGVFRRFKAFLRKIYNLAKNVGAMPSAEVQAVMARMIATEEEIKAAQLDERFRPMEKLLGKESIESILGETEAELYQRWTQEAQEEAEDILRKRVMKDLKKEAREEFNQKVEAERERKRAELENDPVYLAEYAMREGGDTDVVMNWFPSYAAYKKARGKRKTLEEELQAYVDEYARNLDEQIMQAHLSDENVARAMQTPKAYHRRLAIESAALRRKDRLMRVLGGNAPEEVKKKAAEDAERKESDTRRGTKEQTRKEYERSAYAYEKFLREQARMYLRERTISESCNPRFFRRKERQYARALNKAATAGKWSEVLELKEQQAFAAACAYAAEENEKRLNQLLANVKRKLSARTVRLAADERYWLNHIGYLLGLKANDAEKPVDCTKLSDLFAQYKDNNDIDACDPSDLLDLITEEKKKYKDMQLDDFADIVNAMNVLYNVGRNRNEMLTKSMQGKTKDDILTEIFTDDTTLKPSGVVERPVSDDVGGMGYSELLAKIPLLGEVVAKAAQAGNKELTKPELILRLMGDKAHRYIYGTYERAQMKESELLEEKRAALEKIFSVYSKSEKMKWSKKNINAYGDMLSKEEVFCLAFNWGTETNRKRVMDDIGQRLDVMRTLKENMTEKDWKVVQEVWNLLDTFWEESARTEERLNGAHIGKVPASAFTIETADGKEITLQGGYYPLRYNPKKASKVNDKQTEEDVKGRMTGAQVFGTKRGHVKERSKGDVIAPVLLQFDVLKDHIFNASHNIAFRIAARDVYRIINDKEFEAYVSSTYGRPIYNYLKQWAVDVWAVPVEASDSAAMGINRIIGGLRRNSTMAIMGWRLWPCLENTLTNTLLNMDKIGVRKTAEAYLEGLPIFGKGPKALRDMAKKSAFMADRISNMERDIRRDPHIFDPTYAPLEFLRDNAYFGISFTDQLFSVPLWNKVYKEAFPKALAQINEENEANKRTYKEAQDRVYALRAEIYDLRREMEELVDPSLQERIREKEKEFAQAGLALERASELPVYDERARIQEAETRAVQAGDAAVRDTFGSGQTKDLPGAQRTRSELFKLFTSFFSFFNTQYNAALEAQYRGKYSKTGYKHIHVWMPLARTILFRIVLVGVLGGLGKATLGLEGDDDKDKYRKVKDPKTGETIKVEIPWEDRWMKIVMKNTLSTATGMFPGVRDFAGFALDQIFDGTTYGRTFEFGALASRGGKQALATWNLIMKKGEDDLKREEEEEKERARVKKMTKQQRKRYEEDKKYRKPKKEIGYLDIAKSAAQTVSTLTATRHGVTNTVSDGLFSIALYVEDMMETDNYYDPDIRNVLRAVLFDKKLRPREVPEKPKKPKKKSRTRGAR
ncbi:hypothetical protein [uncultured Selenomonas sp.]|uniref:MuF-C-terminal domain-containing protein n=1 Tax=uncultured Selenomonas sp. TaxID=159275 RepID=UPI0028D7CFF3|nr:hypothetical protein [uncultured Selenomonas sp.]